METFVEFEVPRIVLVVVLVLVLVVVLVLVLVTKACAEQTNCPPEVVTTRFEHPLVLQAAAHSAALA